MSYFDFFCNNISNNVEAKEIITGSCYTMCPQDEVDLRIKENLIHILEVDGTEKKLVKSYSRSAADSNMAVPHLLRPYTALKETLQYLLLEVLIRRDVPTIVLYDFVNDRLRAIRQDMIIQRLSSKECASLLEPMIRFYVYFAYRLYDLPFKDFDPVLNKKYLLECLKWFLCCCDKMMQRNDDNINDLIVTLSSLDIDETCSDRILMESLYILCNLNDVHPLLRYLSLSKDIKRNQTLNLAYKIAIANIKGDFINVCRNINKLCPLTYYAMYLYLPEIQKNALQVLSYAYNSKQLMVPSEVLQNWLCFGSTDEALSVCRHYGLETVENAVKFVKINFKKEIPIHHLQRTIPIEKNLSIEDIFTYRSGNL